MAYLSSVKHLSFQNCYVMQEMLCVQFSYNDISFIFGLHRLDHYSSDESQVTHIPHKESTRDMYV